MGKRLAGLTCVILCIALFLMGCQSKTPSEVESDQIYYLADYQNVEPGCYVDDLYVVGEKAYFAGHTGDSATNDLQTIVGVMDLSDFSIDVLPIAFDVNNCVFDLTVHDENIYFVSQSVAWNDDKTDLVMPNYALCIYDLQGNNIGSFDVTKDIMAKNTVGETIYINGIEVDSNGNIVITDGNNFLLTYDKDGKQLSQILLEDTYKALLSDEEDTIYCIMSTSSSENSVLSKVEASKGQLSEVNAAAPSGYGETSFIADGMLYLTSGNTVKSVNLKNGETLDVFNWSDYSFVGSDMKAMQKLDDGTYFSYTITVKNESFVMETVRFTQSDVPPQGKTIITYGTYGTMDLYTEKAIAEFNRQSKEYQVKIIDYSSAEYSALGGFQEAILNTEVADVINLQGAGNFYSYAEKGLFADLNAMFEADGTIQREDYFSNALEGYEVDGKLYTIPIFFSVETGVGQASKWGEKTSVSLDELLVMAEEDPKMEFLYCSTKSMWLTNALFYRMEQYVDFDKGKCYFDSEEFVKELEFANCFPEEYQLRSWEENSEESIAYYRNGKNLLQSVYNFKWVDIQHLKGVYGEDIVFVGYPGNVDDKATLTSDFLLGIYEDSENKEGAWEFIKFLLSEEYQNTVFSYYTPLHIGVFEQRMQDAMVPHMEKNLDGEEVEVPVTTYIYGHITDGIKIPVYHATEEEVDMCRDVITNAMVRRWDSKINNIISEESQAYFEGQKSAEEVASIIQNRVSTYLSESQ